MSSTQLLTATGPAATPITPFTLTTSGGVASQSLAGLAAGTYSIAETVPAGWRQTGATCDNGNPPSNVQLAPGQTVRCTFDNEKQDTIIVVKRAVGGDGTFPFVSQTLGDFNLKTVKGEARRSFGNLAPGVYDLSETVPAGWTLSGTPTCSDGSPADRIDLRAGETVVCVFVNLKQDTLVIEKRATGGDGTFPFTSPNPQIGAFDLTTSGGVASRSFAGLPAGTYSIAETVPAGWRQTGATCDNGNPPSNVQLAPGQTVRCTFDNEKQDTITVVKRAVGGDGTFAFTSQKLGNFGLTTANGEARRSFGNLTPGVYDLAETVPAGWTLSGATCSDGSNPASVQLSPGEAVTCTFTNLKQNSIVVEKQTQGGDGTFAFASAQLGAFDLTTSRGGASRAFAALPAGTYAISERPAAGWTLSGATCDNGDAPNNVRLGSGQSVKCTFVNQKTTVDIPTLSQWGLLLLGALLALTARWHGPMRPAGRR